uniref:DYW domain-containing protein n=1 Tax=Solanum lycopersicum TaxID=4081 RepID=K4D7Y3_SOLLC
MIENKYVYTWNSMILSYVRNGHLRESLNYFNEMLSTTDVKPDFYTFPLVLKACNSIIDGVRIHYSSIAQTKSFRCCRSVHGFVLRRSWIQVDVIMDNVFVDMYAKLGLIHCSRKVFNEIPIKDIVSWNSIITRYAYTHLGELQEGTRTNGHVFKVALNLDIFISTSLIDLYGKCEKLSCHGIHGNGRVSLKLFNDLLNAVDLEKIGYYVVLFNTYANCGKCEGVNEVRSLATDKGLKKTPGWSSIDLNNKIEVFYTENKSHPQCHEIYEELGILTDKIKTLSYTPDYTFVLQYVENEEKE